MALDAAHPGNGPFGEGRSPQFMYKTGDWEFLRISDYYLQQFDFPSVENQSLLCSLSCFSSPPRPMTHVFSRHLEVCIVPSMGSQNTTMQQKRSQPVGVHGWNPSVWGKQENQSKEFIPFYTCFSVNRKFQQTSPSWCQESNWKEDVMD